MRVLLLLTVVIMKLNASAQGSLVIHTPPELDTLMMKTYEKNKQKHTFSGFRIQIYQGTNRKEAFEIKKEVMSLLPNDFVKLVFNEPHYKVRVGNYRSKLEAQKLYQTLIKIYPQAFIIPDKIDLNEINE